MVKATDPQADRWLPEPTDYGSKDMYIGIGGLILLIILLIILF